MNGKFIRIILAAYSIFCLVAVPGPFVLLRPFPPDRFRH